MTDLLGGHIDIAMDSSTAYVPNVKEGSSRRLPSARSRWRDSDVQTAANPGCLVSSQRMVRVAPAKAPPEIVAKLNAATNAFLNGAQAREMFDGLNRARRRKPDDLKAYRGRSKWAPIVKAANITF